jgi:hypothetical protein
MYQLFIQIVSVLVLTKSDFATGHSTFSQENSLAAKSWVGIYVRKSDGHKLIVKDPVDSLVSMDLLERGAPSNSPNGSHLIAKILGNTAVSKFQHSPECVLRFQLKERLIKIEDQCGGQDSGIYEKQREIK